MNDTKVVQNVPGSRFDSFVAVAIVIFVGDFTFGVSSCSDVFSTCSTACSLGLFRRLCRLFGHVATWSTRFASPVALRQRIVSDFG